MNYRINLSSEALRMVQDRPRTYTVLDELRSVDPDGFKGLEDVHFVVSLHSLKHQVNAAE